MPTAGMILSKSAGLVIPIFKDLVVDEREIITTERDNINRKAFIALYMMPAIFLVIAVVSIFKPSYASLGLGFWFSIIYYLSTIIYLCWLRNKEQALDKYRVKIADLVLKHRKRLPMVEADNVEADQPANDLINLYCHNATVPLGSILNDLIFCAALGGLIGIGFCGRYYWSRDTLQRFGVAMTVMTWICYGGCYYFWKQLQVK